MEFLEGDQLWMVLLIALVCVEGAKRVCAVIPGKRADDLEGVFGTLHKGLRKVVDFVAGKTGRADDPSLIKRD